MAEFTYETRRKITEDWVKEFQERGRHLSERDKKLLPNIYGSYYAISREVCGSMRNLLTGGRYRTLSDLYRNDFKELTDVCVPKEYQDEFYYALDEMNQYQMTAGWYRRSLRSESYAPFVEQSVKLLRSYAKLTFYGSSLSDILTGNTPPEIYDHARNEYFPYAEILAAQIDRGNETAIQAVEDILLGEGNTAMISYELIRGIVMSKNEELYGLLGKFLLAARLQEGARQAVCETMDAGRKEAFLHLFTVIEENDLIRFTSISNG